MSPIHRTRTPGLYAVAGRPLTRLPADCKHFRAARRPAARALRIAAAAEWIARLVLIGFAVWVAVSATLGFAIPFLPWRPW